MTGAESSHMSSRSPHRCRSALICLLLALVTVGTFWPVLRCDFVRYDDDKYILDNPSIKTSLTLKSVTWAFTSPHYHMWHPLTTLSFLLDYELFGLNPAGYHAVNLLFHLANVLVLFLVLQRMTGVTWPSVFVAAVFAVHPLQVESVAWIAERKNVLSGLFWLLTMAAYLRYADRPRIGRYLLVIVALCLGLMTKPSVVTLPFALLLLDYWPLERVRRPHEIESAGGLQTARPRYSPWLLFAEKVPMFALVAAVAAMTFLAQKAGGVLGESGGIPLVYRLANASISYLTYIEKMIWPSRLAVFYPHPGADFSPVRLAVSIPVLVLLTACCIYCGRRRRYLAAGWLWYLGMLVPVIGIVQAGAQAWADRYMYITMIGLLVIVAWTLRDILRRWSVPSLLPAAAAVVVLGAAALGTSRQLQYWRNGTALFKHAIDVTKNNYVMHNNYANRLSDIGQRDLAIMHLKECLRLRPDSPEANNNLGNALLEEGRTEEAIACYEKAIELAQHKKRGRYPPRGLAEAHHNLANVLRRQGRLEQAREHYAASLESRPDNLDALSALGGTLTDLGRYDRAIGCFNRILELQSDHIIAHGLLGMALAKKGDLEGAARQFRIVLQHDPEDLEMYCNLGIVLRQQGKIDQAIDQFRRALQVDPDYAKADRLLQAALKQQKDR